MTALRHHYAGEGNKHTSDLGCEADPKYIALQERAFTSFWDFPVEIAKYVHYFQGCGRRIATYRAYRDL
jgi:hypothetical protein